MYLRDQKRNEKNPEIGNTSLHKDFAKSAFRLQHATLQTKAYPVHSTEKLRICPRSFGSAHEAPDLPTPDVVSGQIRGTASD